MPFDPNQPFSVEGDTAVADAPKGFDPSKPFTVEDAADPVTQGQQKSQSYLDALNAGQAPLADSPEAHYAAAKDYFDGDALTQTVKGAGGGVGNFFKHPTVALGNIGTALGEWDRNASTQFDREAQNHPLTGIPRLVGSGITGLASGIVGLADKGVNLLDDAGNYGNQLIGRATGDANPGRDRAYADYYQRQNAAKLASATNTVRNAVPVPTAFDAGEQTAPFLVPLPSLGLAGPIARIGKGIGNFAEDATLASAKAAPYVGPAVGIAASALHANPLGLAGNALELAAGTGGGIYAKKILPALAPKVGSLAEQVTDTGLNTAAAGATNLGFSLAGAPAGSAEQNAESAMANTALFSPISIYHGANVRQGMAQAAENSRLTNRGMASYGIDPTLDTQHAAGMQMLSSDERGLINANRGLLRDAQTSDGKPLQIYVQTPGDFANRLASGGGDTTKVANATGALGYHQDNTGKVFINAGSNNVQGSLTDALGHEINHAVIQDALPAVNPKMAAQLEDSVYKTALDSKAQPTPDFQKFIDSYSAQPVEWNALPDDAENGQSKRSYLREFAAQVGNAAYDVKNPALLSLGPEASDSIGNALSHFAQKIGIKKSPDIGQLLPGNVTQEDGSPSPELADYLSKNVPAGTDPASLPDAQQASLIRAFRASPQGRASRTVLADPSLMGAMRKALFQVGDSTNANRNAPVRIADADKTSQKTTPNTPQSQASTLQPAPEVNTSTSPQPDTSFRQTQAYQDALAATTAPRKNGGMGLKAVAAQLLLDQAARDPAVPNDATAYFGYAQKQRTPVIPPKTDAPTPTVAIPSEPQGVTTSLTPSPFPNVPTVSPTAKRIYLLPGGPGGAKRIELPQAQPALTLPTAEPVAQKVVPPKAEPVNRFAGMDEPPVTGPRDVESASNDASTPSTQLEQTSQGQSDTANRSAIPPAELETPRRQSQTEDSSPNPTPDTSAPASPLSPEDIARVESEAEAAHQPNAYPRSSPESRAQKQAADLAKAKADAVAKAHSDSLPPEDDRVRATVDPDSGAVKLSGKRFVDGDAFHDQLLRNATDGEKANLSTVQDAIGQGKALNFDYDSALPLRGEDTSAQRQESQALSTATDRESGVGLAQEANHTFVPLSASPTASGHAQVYGYAPDKILGNAETAIRLMRDSGLSDRLPYTGINDPSLTADIRVYTENHVNGYKGDGSAKLQPTEGINVPQGDPNYQPQSLPPAKAHFINLIMGQDDTLSQKQAVKTGPNTGKPTNSATLRNFAAANDNVPSAAGEVNPLRDELNRKGVLKVGNDKGSGEVLHSAFENIKPGLITRFHDQPGTSEVPPLRASSFEGDRGSIAPGGQVPNRQASAAGFLPAREAGATPNQVADAAKQWQEKGTDSPYFKNWFGDSKIVDDQGKPMLVYHGTNKDFDQFSDTGKTDAGWHGPGFYFYPKELWSKGYGDRVIPSYLSLENPAIRQTSDAAKTPQEAQSLRKQLEAAGHDGVMAYDSDGTLADIVAFKPEQIKSATSNNGQFNPKDPRISFLPAREAGPTKAERFTPEKGGILFHGTNAPEFTQFRGSKTYGGEYLAPDPENAGDYAGDKIPGTSLHGEKPGQPRVIRVQAKPGKALDLDSDPKFQDALENGEVDEYLGQKSQEAKDAGYRYLTHSHPATSGDDFKAHISLYPKEDLKPVNSTPKVSPLEARYQQVLKEVGDPSAAADATFYRIKKETGKAPNWGEIRALAEKYAKRGS